MRTQVSSFTFPVSIFKFPATDGTYGSALYPELPGSGGWAGAAGGAVKIAATGTVRVDGIIDADTVYAQEGPGSGGSILITCRVFDGAGTLRACGGTGKSGGNGSGGGGGRIAVHYDPAAQAAEAPDARTITIMASGGGYAATHGSPGTAYLPDLALLRSPDFNISGSLLFGDGASSWSPASLTLAGRQVAFAENFSLTVVQGLTIYPVGLATTDIGTGIGSLTLVGATQPQTLAGAVFLNRALLSYTYTQSDPQPVTVGGDMILTNGAVVRLYPAAVDGTRPYGGRLNMAGDLMLYTNCVIYPYSDTTNGASVEMRAKNVAILENGKIDVNMKGFQKGYGPGRPGSSPNGAGYGGRGGGSTGGPPYGYDLCPTNPGSGSNASAGGGLIWIVTDSGTIRVDGRLDAGAVYTQEGGGSGGGILLVCKRFEGSGLITAHGGDADQRPNKGGGAGGRIAVLQMDIASYERVLAGQTNGMQFAESVPATFTGTLSVAPGGTTAAILAEPGTIRFGSLLPRGFMLLLR